MAQYLYTQAVTVDDPTIKIAIAVNADTMSFDEAKDRIEAILLKSDTDAYDQSLAALRGSLSNEPAFVQAVDRLAAVHLLDDEGFNAISNGLMTALSAGDMRTPARLLDSVIDAREVLLNDVARIDRAEEHLLTAMSDAADPELARTFGVHFRQDMSADLANLLQIDPKVAPGLETVRRVMQGYTSGNEAIPGKRYKKPDSRSQPTAFLDLTFSAGKSVSVTYGLSSPEDRQLIQDAHNKAVDTAMHRIADAVGFVRLGDGGSKGSEPGDVAWISFEHHYSRTGDPQLHNHVALLNVVKSRESDKVGSLPLYNTHGHFKEWRETYQKALTVNLGKLGLQVEYDSLKIEARIVNVPDHVIEVFSQRTAQAEAFLREHGIEPSKLSPSERSAAMTQASFQTRQPAYAVQPDPGNWSVQADSAGWAFTSTISPNVRGVQSLHTVLNATQKQAQAVQAVANQPGQTQTQSTTQSQTAQRVQTAIEQRKYDTQQRRSIGHTSPDNRYNRADLEEITWKEHVPTLKL
jgi:conjugative relaxase-like TrwC/TraI family protein